MGADKAFLELDGRTLLARALENVRSVTDNAHIVGPRGKFQSFAPVVEDIYPDRGPLGGIHAALHGSDAELNLMLGVDLPFVTPALLRFIVDQAAAGDAAVTVPKIGGGYQPLCAVYRREFRAPAQEALENGRNTIDALFAATRARVLGEAELARFAFSPRLFENLNTPEDWERARAVRR